jgi:hypothetical protein
VLVSENPSTIVRAIRDQLDIIVPTEDLARASLEVANNGCAVRARYSPGQLGISDVDASLIIGRYRGLDYVSVAESVAYSSRQCRRHISALCSRLNCVPHELEWLATVLY